MYSQDVSAWIAAGAIALGGSAALAQYQPEEEETSTIEQPSQQESQQEPQAVADEAQQQSLQGTVMEASRFLTHGEQAADQQPQDQPQQQQQQLGQSSQQPLVLLTEEGEAYLILEKPQASGESGLQPPLEAPVEEPMEIQEQQEEAEPNTGIRSPVRNRLAPHADYSLRASIAQREQERQWEQHPGEWRSMDPEEQEQLQLDSPQQIEQPDAQPQQQQDQQLQQQQQAQQPSRVYQQLKVGQQFTLTGEVHERGGLRGIIVDEYSIESEQQDQLEQPMGEEEQQLEEPMQAPGTEPIEQPTQTPQQQDMDQQGEPLELQQEQEQESQEVEQF